MTDPALSFNDKNSLTAKGGFEHQREFIRLMERWRIDPIAARIAITLFGHTSCCHSSHLMAGPYPDATAKPDVLVKLIPLGSGSPQIARVSLKMISTEQLSGGPTHHAGRVPFRDARDAKLFPTNDPLLEAALLEHFVDGESISTKSPDLLARLSAYFSGPNLIDIALLALRGPEEKGLDDFIVITKSTSTPNFVKINDVRILPTVEAATLCAQTPFTASIPNEGRVGTIGNSYLHLQRGQALSAGEQRDIQLKINALALFEHGRLDSINSFHSGTANP